MSLENKKTALIIEDSPTQAMRLECLLSQNGLEVISARDGEKGYHHAQLRLPDVIVLDVELPGMNGLQVCKLLKENKHTHFIPVILFTSMKMEAAQFGSRIGEVIHILKDEHSDVKLLEILRTKGLITEINLLTV